MSAWTSERVSASGSPAVVRGPASAKATTAPARAAWNEVLLHGCPPDATIASTAVGESVLAFATSPSSVPFGIDALSASIRATIAGVHRMLDDDAGALGQRAGPPPRSPRLAPRGPRPLRPRRDRAERVRCPARCPPPRWRARPARTLAARRARPRPRARSSPSRRARARSRAGRPPARSDASASRYRARARAEIAPGEGHLREEAQRDPAQLVISERLPGSAGPARRAPRRPRRPRWRTAAFP